MRKMEIPVDPIKKGKNRRKKIEIGGGGKWLENRL